MLENLARTCHFFSQSWFILNTEFAQFNCPLSHPPRKIKLVMVLRRGRSVSTTMGCDWKYGQSFFIATRRANAACSRWLYRVSASIKDFLTKNTGLCFLFSSSLNRAALTETYETPKYTKSVLTSETPKYTKSVSPASGLARTGGSTRYYLISVRASSHSSFHPAWLAPLRVTKNGFRRSINREMNHPKAANRPVSCCTPFLEAEPRTPK